MAKQFEIITPDSTKDAAAAYIAELDRQIDTLADQLELAQAVRAAVARAHEIDRRANVGPIASLIDSAKRGAYEGKSDGEAA